MGDFAEFRVHARGENRRLGFSRRHRGAGEEDVFAVNQFIRFGWLGVPL
jgi:hypothetical protein